jgi:hypothetical protein
MPRISFPILVVFIYRSLLHAPDAYLLGRQLGDDVVRIATRSSEAVEAGGHKRVTFVHPIEALCERYDGCRRCWRWPDQEAQPIVNFNCSSLLSANRMVTVVVIPGATT